MKIGILGSNDRAVTIGRLLQRSGNAISFSDPPEGLDNAEKAAAALGGGAKACSAYDQVAGSDVLVMAIPSETLDTALSVMGPVAEQQIVIDTMQPPASAEQSGAEQLAHKLDSRHVVKAFLKPIEPGQPIELCSDDPTASQTVAEMISAAGYTPLDGGPLLYARDLERAVAKRPAVNSPD